MSEAFWRGWIRGSGLGGIYAGIVGSVASILFQWNNWKTTFWLGVLAIGLGVINLAYVSHLEREKLRKK